MNDLNDPLDCQPAIKGGPEQLDDEEYAAYERNELATLYEYNGLLCYSAVVDDPVIWSHYADSHRGMALEFEFADQAAPRRVFYPPDNLRQQLDLSDPDIQGDSLYAMDLAFFTKAKSWEYEKEYREIIELAGCRMAGPDFFCKPTGILRRIILGVRSTFSVSEAEFAISDLWPMYNGRRPIVTKATISRDSFRLRVG